VGRRIHAYRQPCCDVRRGGAEGAGLRHFHTGTEVYQSKKPGQLLELVGWMWTFMRLDWTGLDGRDCQLGLDWMLI